MKTGIIRRLSALLALVLTVWTATGASFNWTNTNGGSWSAPENWDPNGVPGPGDSAVITNNGSYLVSGSAAGTVDSLVLGGGSGTQTLVIDQNGFSCSGAAVGSGAVLVVNGYFQAQELSLSGTMIWENGWLTAAVTVATNGVLNISGDAIKTLGAGASLTNYGTVSWNGLGGLNAEDYLYGPGHPVIANMPGGVFSISNDSMLQLDSFMYDQSLAFVFVNAGTVRKVAGSGTTIFRNVQFANTGTVDVQQGTLQFVNSGTGSLSSAGLFTVAGGAAVELSGGTCTLLPGHQAQGQGLFGLGANDMPVTLQGQLAGRFDWTGGWLQGQWTVATNGVLNISGDAIKTLGAGASLTNYGAVNWSGFGGLNAEDYLFGPGHPVIANMPGGVFSISNDNMLQLDSFMYDPSLAFVFVNAGTVRKVAGSGTTIFRNVQFANTGTVDVQQGTLQFVNSGTGSLSSAGLFTVAGGAAVELSGGTCTFLPGHQAQGQGLFGLGANDMPVTLQGQLAGRFDWTGGWLQGQWTVATNGVLNISGDAIKTLGAGASLTNYGAVNWSGFGGLNAEDYLFGPGHPVIANMPGGVFSISNDNMLQLDSFMYDPSLAFVFVNAGTVRKVAGSGTTIFKNVQFANTGTVDVQQGTLQFVNSGTGSLSSAGLFSVAAGALVELSGGTCTFLPGHQAQGQGLFGLGANDMPVTLQGQLAGRFDWTGGWLQGQWTVATNGVLNISGDAIKTLGAGASLTNYGAVNWSGFGGLNAEDYLFGPGHPVIANMPGGVFSISNDNMLQLDSFMYDPSLAFVFVNAGTVRKVAGSGTTIFKNVQFANTGAVDVQQGTLQFVNSGTGSLSSAGLFSVAAGALVELSGGTCTFLPGHQAQGQGLFGLGANDMPVTLQGQLAGRFDWTGGWLQGQWTVATNGVLNISGDAIKTLGAGASLTNYGAVNWSGFGGLNAEDYLFGPGHPVIANMPGGLFEISDDSMLQLDSFIYDSRLAFVFANGGTVRKLGGSGTTIFRNLQFANTGTVDVQQGTLQFAGSQGQFVSSGTFLVAASAAVQLSEGTATFQEEHISQGGGFFGVIDGANVTLNGTLNSALTWSGGAITSDGLSIETNGLLSIVGESSKYLFGPALTNAGTVNWSGHGQLMAYSFGPPNPVQVLWNMSQGVINLTDDVQFADAGSSAQFEFHNAGLLRKTGGEGTASFDNLVFSNSGTLEVWSGSLGVGSPSGYGVQWHDSGLIRLAVAVATNFSSIQSVGTSDLTGQLEVVFANGYLPAVGDSFALLTYASANVSFNSINLPAVPAGLYLATLVDSNQLVVAVRQDPLANPDTFTLNGDTPADLDVLANDSNLYGGGVILGFTQPSHGVVSLNPNNTLHYVPAQYFSGTDGFTYQAQNADGKIASAAVSLQILAINHAPVLAALPNQTIDEGSLLTFAAQASDVDGNQLAFTLGPAAPNGATIHPVTGVFTWTPSEAQGPGVYTITVTVTDNGSPNLSSSATFTATVREVNTAPVLSAIPNQTVSEQQPFSRQLSATDSDLPANTLTFFLASGPSGLTVSAAGLVAWTPSEAQGPSTNLVSVAVKDDGQPSLSATQSFQIVVSEINTAPVVPVQTNQFVIDELTRLVVTNTATDSDLPANVLTYTLLNAPAGASIDTNGIITWTPTEAQGPSSNLVMTVVTDNGQPPLSATNSFVVLVNEVNSAPSLAAISTQTVNEITALSLQASATDSDLPANHLTFALVSGPEGLTVSPEGLVSWTPTEVQGPGNYSVTISVSDEGVPSLSSTQSFSIAVNEVNLPPSLAPISPQSVAELTTFSLQLSASDPDLPANHLTFGLASGPAGLSVSPAGLVSWTPTEAQGPSTNQVVVQVTDDGLPSLSATQSFSIVVNEVNTAPVLSAIPNQTVSEQRPFSLQLSATDSDLPANTLTFFLASGPSGLTISAAGLIAWTPSEAQGPGTNLVSVAVKDDGQPSLSVTQSFQIVVSEINTAPVLPVQTNQFVVDELTQLVVTNTATDSDLPANVLTYTLLNGPGGASIDTNGIITWTPTEAQGPSSNLVVTVVTDNGQPPLNATNSFVVLVNEVNSAPSLAVIQPQTVEEMTPFSLQASATDSDLPSNHLTFALVSGPAGLTVNSAGLVNWTPTEAQGPGNYNATISVRDDGIPSLSSTQTFSIVVNEVNLRPSLAPVSAQSIAELTAFSLQLSATDPDLPANHLTFGLVSGPAGLSVSSAGLMSWTPTEAQGPSTNQVVVQVADDGLPSLSATQSFTIVVNEVNAAPVLASISSQTVLPGQALSLAFSATDSDLPANILTFTLNSAPAGATVTADGHFAWTPAFSQAGSTNATVVRVTDNGTPSLSSTQMFSIVVLNTGLKADYFAGTNFDSLVLTRDDAQVDFNWGAGSPGPGLPTNQFSVRWTGQVIPRYSETYTFYTVSDDGVRLWVDGQPIINNWTLHSATTNTGTIALTAGQTYMLRLEYFDASSNSISRLMWSSTSQTKEIVPSSQLLCTGYSDLVPNAIYRFTPQLATGRCMEVANSATADGSQVDINNWKASSNQKWQAVPTGSNYFKFIPQHALTKVLELNGGFTTNGTKIQIATDNGTSRQRFQFIDLGQGWFKILPQPAPVSVLDLKGGNSANGTAIQLNQDLGTDSEHWRLDRQ